MKAVEDDTKIAQAYLLLGLLYFDQRQAEKAEKTKLAPEIREAFIRAIKFKLDLLFAEIETAREYGVYPSVIITGHGRPTLQVEE